MVKTRLEQSNRALEQELAGVEDRMLPDRTAVYEQQSLKLQIETLKGDLEFK